MSDTFDPEKIIKRTKGKMIMLYAVVGDEEVHMASFFHADKAQYVLDAISIADDSMPIVDEDKPKKKKKSVAKKAPAKKKGKK